MFKQSVIIILMLYKPFYNKFHVWLFVLADEDTMGEGQWLEQAALIDN